MAIFAAIYLVVFCVFKMYSSLWSVSGLNEGINIIAGVGIGTAICIGVNLAFFSKMQSEFLIGLSGMFLGAMAFSTRFGYRILRRIWTNINNRASKGKKAIMIVGAGNFGSYVLGQIEAGARAVNERAVLFVDDDPQKQRMSVGGIRVLGTCEDIPELAQKYDIDEIIIAIPSLNTERRREIVSICAKTKRRVLLVPGIWEVGDNPSMAVLREMSIADILFRQEVSLDQEGISDYITDKVVLITGGGGSIGSEIARQVAMFTPSRLILFDIYENTTYELYCELKQRFPELDVMVRIGSVRDKARLDELMLEFKPNLVVHTAAHKHVPLMEDSPAEAVKNNVLGTLNVLKAAEEHGVERFVQLSTDKAVNPTNVMGATKRITELIVQVFAATSRMRCMTVRFGNVLGSHGSVIPLFERQIKAGGPVTVTHPEVTRYFMTIPEAAQLVLQAGSIGESGAIYVLDMGEPIRIIALAEKMIRFYGYEPGVNMEIEIVGLRPGEKMYEELLLDDESECRETTSHGRIFKTHPATINHQLFMANTTALIRAAIENEPNLIDRIRLLVPNFNHPDDAIA
ncbi:MAG: nucleoside-diphosphate sugar epimerase/dehydratase [Clostridia bacterium]|nr:nucleoside-diphosphate sugar epimerase/dehydratase [Clostridia bacterium]